MCIRDRCPREQSLLKETEYTMKHATITLDGNKIEIHNSMLGKETIKVNDETVSLKRSLTGNKHVFTILDNGEQAECKIILGYGRNGIVFDLFKNGEPIIESPRSNFLIIFFLFLEFYWALEQ